ncbi:MAG: phosphatase PAP2 family protein [Planctomycetota bacterium]|nr:phosphatase PAP2 family protein [Planctomycetota bacterium]
MSPLSAKRWFYAALAAGLAALAGYFFLDQYLYAAIKSSAIATGDSTALGGLLALIRIFGVADTVVILALIFGALGRRREAASVLVGLAIMAALVLPLKNTVGRMRPDHSEPKSFPSGDTATASVLPAATQISPATTAGFGALAVGVAASRLFYQRHYFSDVVAGAFIGLLSGALGYGLTRRLENFSRVRRLLPPRRWWLLGLAVWLAGEFYGMRHGWHTRHITQFFAWCGPAAALIFAASVCRLQARRREAPAAETVSYVVIVVIAWALMLGVWGVDLGQLGGWRIPLFSLGLTLWIFARQRRKMRAAGRRLAAQKFTRFAAALALIYAVGYASGRL